MLDIGFTELLLIAVISLVVLGPERLPGAVRTTAYWIGKVRRSFQSVKDELEKELDVDGIKRQIHNEAVMKELEKTREQFESAVNEPLQKTREELLSSEKQPDQPEKKQPDQPEKKQPLPADKSEAASTSSQDKA